MKLELIEFFKYFIIHPDSDLLDNKTDRVTALISSIALGIFTLGLCHLVCAVAFRSYKPIEPGSRTIASDVARRVLNARPPDGEERREAKSGSSADKPLLFDTKTPVSAPEILNPKPPAVRFIDKAAADRARLEKLGFTLENVYTKIQVFLSSSEDSLSLARDRVVTIKNSIISLNFSDVSHDLEFLFQKALEKGKSEGSADFDNIFVRILQACQTLSLDYEDIISFKPFINLEIQEPSSDGLKKEICPIPTQMFFYSPILQRMIFRSIVSLADSLSIILPENYSIDHFKAYVEMSTHPEYDFSAEEVFVLLDMLQLADYFENRDLVSRLDRVLKAPFLTLEDVAYFLERLPSKDKSSLSLDEDNPLLPADTYLSPLETHVSLFINELITNAFVEGSPLDELVAQLHSLDTSKWLQTHPLELDFSLFGFKINDTVLENLSGLKISDLSIAYSEVTRFPDAWLASIRTLDISKTKIAVLQSLPGLKSLKSSQRDIVIDISNLDANTHLEKIEITGDITRLPTGLIGLKKFTACLCRNLTNLDALADCIQLKQVDLFGLTNLARIPPNLREVEKITITNCPLITAA